MELRHVRYFAAVAETLSFTRAAKRLHTSQPSLSQQIRQLEAELGVALFERSRRAVRLTDAGAAFLPEARAILVQVGRAAAAARGASATVEKIVVGFLLSVEGNLLQRLLPEVRRDNPDLHVELRCMTTVEQAAALLQGDIDVAFLRVPQDDPRLHCELVLEEPIHVVVPEDHPLAAYRAIEPGQLDGAACLGTSRADAGTLRGIVVRWAANSSIRMDLQEQAGNVLVYMAMVRLGRGVGLLPEFATTMLLPGLVSRPIVQAPTIGLGMATVEGPRRATVDRFLAVARKVLTEALPKAGPSALSARALPGRPAAPRSGQPAR